MKLPAWAPRVGAFLLLAILAFSAVRWHDHAVADQALATAHAKMLQARIDSLTRVKDSTTILYRRDTVRLTTAVTRWREFRDTLLRSDTITLTVRESVLVFRADSVVRQCEMTAQTCAQLQAEKDSIITTQQRQLDNERQRRPGFLRRAGDHVKWIAAGALLTTLVKR